MTGPDAPFDIKYHEANFRDYESEGNVYFRAYVPETINYLNIEEGDYTEVEIRRPDEKPVYLRYERVPPEKANSSKHYEVTKTDSSYLLTIPAGWSDELISDRNADQLVIEINFVTETPHLRIYSLEDYYQQRKPELENQGYDIQKGEKTTIGIFSASMLNDSSEDLRSGFGEDIDDEESG